MLGSNRNLEQGSEDRVHTDRIVSLLLPQSKIYKQRNSQVGGLTILAHDFPRLAVSIFKRSFKLSKSADPIEFNSSP